MAINLNGIPFSSVRGDSPVDRPASAKSGQVSGSSASGKVVGAADPVQLTSGSQVLREMETNRNQPIDETRVAALRQSIADRSYQVNARQIAEKLSTFESALFKSAA